MIPENQHCSRCHTYFVCGVQSGHDTCWCFELPQSLLSAPPREGASSCVCPRCLASQLTALQRPFDAPPNKEIQ